MAVLSWIGPIMTGSPASCSTTRFPIGWTRPLKLVPLLHDEVDVLYSGLCARTSGDRHLQEALSIEAFGLAPEAPVSRRIRRRLFFRGCIGLSRSLSPRMGNP